MSNSQPKNASIVPEGYRPKEACTILSVGPTKLKELIRTGAIESVLIGRTRIITRRGIERLLHLDSQAA